jgi:hypothetical protein
MMDLVERLKQNFSGTALKDIADQIKIYVNERHEAATEIKQLREMIDVINCKIPLDILWDKDGNERPLVDAMNDVIIELSILRHKLRKIHEESSNGHC